MMFSFFSRKQQEPADIKAAEPEPDAMAVDLAPQQLRTPSPSEAASSALEPAAQIAPSEPSAAIAPVQTLEPTAEAIHARVASVPPKTLQAYVLAQLPTAPQDVLPALAAFFTALTPPPLLHCVRCHADYTDVENSDRACRVAHDDESAEVERVGRGRGDSEYETLWGCCGRTVEGEGDLGPPDGWCYEGMHTTDPKRARFRADSSPGDDKLVSCLRLNCHNIRAHLPRTSGRAKRARPAPAEDGAGDGDDDDDAGSEGTEDTGIAEIARGVGSLGNKGKGKGTGKARVAKPRAPARQAESDAESSKTDSASAPVPAPRARKRRADAKPKSAAAVLTPAKKRTAAAAAAAASSPPDSPRPRGRKPRSAAKMDSVELVLRSRSATRSRVRAGGAETAEEKTMTDVEGKARKRRKIASAAA
ncbi:hypothetical protein BC834DRAFT_154374 [Gloeopeniophorella convolvens]|nr:hypothetical protein BC834DRAFT_154374 [Gloeopeniophorella convolvens]